MSFWPFFSKLNRGCRFAFYFIYLFFLEELKEKWLSCDIVLKNVHAPKKVLLYPLVSKFLCN